MSSGSRSNYNKKTYTFLLFTATWCEACNLLQPLFSDRCEIFKDVANFKTFDIDDNENDQIAIQYKITKIPTIIVINNGKVINCINEHLNETNLDIILETYLDNNFDSLKDTAITKLNKHLKNVMIYNNLHEIKIKPNINLDILKCDDGDNDNTSISST